MRIQLSTILFILLLIAVIGLLGQQSCIRRLETKLAEKCPEGVVIIDTTKVKDSSATGWYRPTAMAYDETERLRVSGQIPPESVPGYITAKQKEKIQEATEAQMPDGGQQDSGVVTADDYFYRPLYFYSDTVKVKYGKIIIQDSTTAPILARNVIPLFEIPVVTKTITLTRPPKAQMYIGLNGQYNPQDMRVHAGPSLMFKSKDDHIYEVGALFNPSQLKQPIIQGSLKFKIKLR